MAGTNVHSCIQLHDNQLVGQVSGHEVDPAITNNKVTNWVQSGNFHNPECTNIGDTSVHSALLTRFSQCSILPLVSLYILQYQITAIVDSGASRSLLSTTLANKLWGKHWQDKLESCNIKLHDVNNQLLPVLGCFEIKINIGSHCFNHNFIMYTSTSAELLIGFDFLKQHNIALYPNYGLVLATLEKIYKIGPEENLILPLRLIDDVTINGGDQMLVGVAIEYENRHDLGPFLADSVLLAHSEVLQPGVEFNDLCVYFQYVKISPLYETFILMINHAEMAQFYKQGTIVAHVEPTQEIAHINTIEGDPLLHAIYLCMEKKGEPSIDHGESRICLDTEHFSFDPVDINCVSSDAAHVSWLTALHHKYKTIFNSEEFQPGCHGSEVHFSVVSNATIINQRFSRINPNILEDARTIIQNLLDRNLIEISDSPYSSRLLFVDKAREEMQIKDVGEGGSFLPGQKIRHEKKRKLRMVIDLRHINMRLRPVNTQWVVPSIWSLLAAFQGAEFISTIDLNSGFWHFPLTKRARLLTAFDFEDVRYQCTRLAQGLKISSSVMQSKMRRFILNHSLTGVLCYVDNILVYGENLQAYKDNLERLFRACQNDNFVIKMKKSHHFIDKSFVIFGYEINLKSHTISPERDKVSKILEVAIPYTKKKVRHFIGSVGYFSNMLPNLQNDMAPLHNLASPKSKFEWTQECQESFDKVKNALAKMPLIFLYNTRLPVHAFCDAAQGSHLAYALYQFSEKYGNYIPIKYNSHKLTDAEQTLSQFETEALALMFCLLREESILSFGNATIHTDARSLCFITKYATATSKISRWDLLLKSYDVQVVFRPNTHALIKMSDLMTRGITKSKFRNRITQSDLDTFLQIDFSEIPPLSMKDTLALIKKALDLIGHTQNTKHELGKIRTVIPGLPQRAWPLNQNASVLFSPGDTIGKIFSAIDFQIKHKKGLALPSIGPLSAKSFQDHNFEQSQKQNIKESILNFLPSVTRKGLIKMQNEEEWIRKLLSQLSDRRVYQNYYIFEGILMRKLRLLNSVLVDQIVLTTDLSKAVIKHFHTRDFFKHMSTEKMQRHLIPIFYIKNFTKLANAIIQSCVFCMYNKVYPNPALKPGLKLHVDGPKKFIFLDICTVRSNADIDSFITILDAFSKYVIYLPIQKDATARIIVDLLFSHWIRYFGFPLTISADGASNFTNRLMGEISSLLKIKLVRIAPYNSKSNMSERWNKFCLFGIKIFHQNYGITDDNFSMILSLIGQMLNSQKMPNGFSPFYLMMGTEPNINLISYQTVGYQSALSQHAQNIVKSQNVCYFIHKMMLNNESKVDADMQNPKYSPGDFVLLRKLSVGPRPMAKARPLYHSQPFRIVKRTQTNAILVPFGLKFIKKRYKFEGDIPKNLCTLQRISHLKPLTNPFKLLKLSLSQKIMLDLGKIIDLNIPHIPQVEVKPNDYQLTADTIVAAYNPSRVIDPNGTVAAQVDSHTVHRLPVVHPEHLQSMRDICQVKLYTLENISQMTTSVPSDLYITSTPDITAVKHKKKGALQTLSDSDSSTTKSTLDGFIIQDSYFESDFKDASNQDSHLSSKSSDSLSQDGSLIETFRTPQPELEQQDDLINSRPRLSQPRSTQSRTITRISLPSGKNIQVVSKTSVPANTEEPVPTPEGSKTPLTIKSSRPRSLIRDLRSVKK